MQAGEPYSGEMYQRSILIIGGPDDDSHARVWLSPSSMAAIEGPALDQFPGWVGCWM